MIELKQAAIGCMLTFCAVANPVFASPEEDGINGIREYENGNLIDGMEMLYRAANGGYAPAQVKLGYILDQSEENEKAIEWFRKAALQGNADAQYGLGSMYAKGDGVEKKFSEAIEWIKKAADQGHRLAIRTYATALEHGELGLSANETETLLWFKKAAEEGDSVAIQRMVDAYRKGELGLAADLNEADKWQMKLTSLAQ
jgi:TPR repeat protein